jgi:hypothetical protein
MRYRDPYKGLPVVVSGPPRESNMSLTTPVHFKGYTGIIKSFNPNNGIADVELSAILTRKTIPFKVDHLRFRFVMTSDLVVVY